MIYSGYFDGAAKPNPGQLGMGASIVDEQECEIDWAYAYKHHGTNNEAEYLSIILLMRQALGHGFTKLDCYGDSQLVIKQINGEWSVSADSLKALNKKALELANQFEHITFNWIERKKNARADKLSNIAIEKKGNDRKKENIIANENKASVKITVAQLPIKNKVVVKQLINGNYLIVEDEVTCIVNAKTMSCSCYVFNVNKQCKHTNTLIECKKQA